MEIKIQIKECNECKHSDHTGTFTKGGAKPCCNHPLIVKEKGYSYFKRIIPYKNKYDNFYKKEFHIAKKIPDWCPLKRNCKY